MTVLLTGDPNSSLATLIIYYVGPMVVLYHVIYDIFILFGLIRKRTAQIISIILTLMIGRLGGFKMFVDLMMKAVSPNWQNGGFFFAIAITLILAILTWILGHFAIGYRAGKNVARMVHGEKELGMIGEELERHNE
jgi:uncharacterized membrane-anchored protein